MYGQRNYWLLRHDGIIRLSAIDHVLSIADEYFSTSNMFEVCSESRSPLCILSSLHRFHVSDFGLWSDIRLHLISDHSTLLEGICKSNQFGLTPLRSKEAQTKSIPYQPRGFRTESMNTYGTFGPLVTNPRLFRATVVLDG